MVETLPCNRACNTSLVDALVSGGIQAAFTVTGAIDRSAFVVFARDVLVPTLRPGQHVIWDNLSVHRGGEERRLIEQAGCTIHFLPAYSPDLNPIELAFSKLKTLLRRRPHPGDTGRRDHYGPPSPHRRQCPGLDRHLRLRPPMTSLVRTAGSERE